jgi:hypothetical protein
MTKVKFFMNCQRSVASDAKSTVSEKMDKKQAP